MKNLDLIIKNENFNPITPSYKINYYNVRNNAWEFLLKNKVTSFPLDLRQIAKNNNWNIWSYKKYCEVNNLNENDIIKIQPDGFSKKIENAYLICYNEKNSKQRNRFTICHEFGHIILHTVYRGEKLEKEANMFAARILMPMLLIKELEISIPEQLAKLCDVSIEAATYRLKRYNEIEKREKFYTKPYEKKLLNQLKKFIKEKKGEKL